jgi:hypothetical protein
VSDATANDAQATSERAFTATPRYDDEPAKTAATDERLAVELRSEQLEPAVDEIELEAANEGGETPEADVVARSDEPSPPPFMHVPRRSQWRWVAPTALAATAVIAVSVTYRFALDGTSHRTLEATAAKRANESEPAARLDQKAAPSSAVVEEPPARMEAESAPPQHLDELAKTKPAPERQVPAPPRAAPLQSGADERLAGGAVVSSAPPAEKKDAAPFAAKPSAAAPPEPATARANAGAPPAEDFARSALRDKERDVGERAPAMNAAAAPAEAPEAAVGGAASADGAIVVVSRANRLLVWRFSGAAIERSDDGGQTWQPQQSPAPAAILAASAPTGQVCWAVGKGGTVIRTLDGRNWQVLESPTTADLVQATAGNESSITVKSSDGHRFSTTDGAATWSER